MNLVLFDLDGTLVDSGAFEGELYVHAVRSVLGIAIDTDWSRYRHETVDDVWMGDGRDRLGAGDIRRALHLYIAAGTLVALTLAVLWWLV